MSELARLRQQAERIQRDLDRGPYGPDGSKPAYMVQLHTQWRADLEVTQDRIRELDGGQAARIPQPM